MSELRKDVVCWSNGDRCCGCSHLLGKSPHCSYRPLTILGRILSWVKGDCCFIYIFSSKPRVKHLKDG